MKTKNTTTLEELIKEYPQTKMNISALLPDFGNLEQAHLTEKVLSITTIEHLARKAGREVSDIIGDLNMILGIQDIEDTDHKEIETTSEDPDWVHQIPLHKIDGVEILTRGEHPLSIIQDLLKEMTPGEIILLTTNFHPQPMLDSMNDAGVTTYSRKDIGVENLYITYIKK